MFACLSIICRIVNYALDHAMMPTKVSELVRLAAIQLVVYKENAYLSIFHVI